MSKRKKENLLPAEIASPPESHGNVKAPQNESHQMTLNRPFGLEREGTELSPRLIEYHLTAEIRNKSLTTRDLSLLLDVLNFQAVSYGVNFNMYLALFELYFRLLGQKRSSKEISDGNVRKTVTVTEILLRVLGKSEFNLDSGIVLEIPSKIKDLLRIGLMSKRTYGSRYSTWRPERFISIKAVPVETLFLTRRKDSVPYSSYCKGYGESHPSAHRKKLRPSPELDGTGESPAELEENFLFRRCTETLHVLSEYLLIRYSNEEEET